MLLRVPLGTSSEGCPATVTRPGLVGCFNRRWLPFVTTTSQPASASILSRSRAFAARLPEKMDSKEQLREWNDQCLKWRKPKWKFSHPSRFRIEAQTALDRSVELGKA